MYTKIGIPENNSLKSKIEELYEWCDKRDNDDELGKTYFNEPIDEDKLNKWEEANGVKIPETYKEWLRFTEKSLMDRVQCFGEQMISIIILCQII